MMAWNVDFIDWFSDDCSTTLPPHPRLKLLYSDDGDEERVVGIATRDMGIGKDGTCRVSQCNVKYKLKQQDTLCQSP